MSNSHPFKLMDSLPASTWQSTISFCPLPLVSILSAVNSRLRNRLRALPARRASVDLSFQLRLTDSAFSAICRTIQHQSVLELNLEECKQLSDASIQFIILHFHQLRSLNITGCRQLTVGALRDISTLHFLQRLKCVRCSGLGTEVLLQIGRCTQLLELDISSLLPCRALMDTTDALRNLRALTTFRANEVPLESRIAFLRDLKSLRHVEIRNSGGFDDLEGLEHLEYLDAFSNDISSFTTLTSSKDCLLHLDVSYCGLYEFQGLTLFTNLQFLVISGNNIHCLDFCSSLPKLETLLMNDSALSPSTFSLQPLVNCPLLHTLGIAFWRRTELDLRPLASLPLRLCSAEESKVVSIDCFDHPIQWVSYSDLLKLCGVEG
eukprot:GILJ01008445.1.p1 GENE.GILJ01008445.1~~GILJ01008445.1.p1  ORF type:complete len:378 (+),score=18.52 GILJ01008445.1:147-1280(+)